jgi:hypothetical protein
MEEKIIYPDKKLLLSFALKMLFLMLGVIIIFSVVLFLGYFSVKKDVFLFIYNTEPRAFLELFFSYLKILLELIAYYLIFWILYYPLLTSGYTRKYNAIIIDSEGVHVRKPFWIKRVFSFDNVIIQEKFWDMKSKLASLNRNKVIIHSGIYEIQSVIDGINSFKINK